MKYGLPKDEKVRGSKAKWKLDMEQQITSLNFQICSLREQFQENVILFKELREMKYMQNPYWRKVESERAKRSKFVVNDNKTHLEQQDFTFKVNAGFNSDKSILVVTQVQPSTSDVPSFEIHGFDGVGTKTETYRVTSELVRGQSQCVPMNLNCISTMPQYKNWSLEELRFQDYIQERKLIVGTHPFRYLPTPYPDTINVNGMIKCITGFHHCITVMPQYENKSLEELRFEDYIIKKQKTYFPQVRYKDIKSRLRRGLRRDDVLRKERNRPKFKPATCGGCINFGPTTWNTTPADNQQKTFDIGAWTQRYFRNSRPVQTHTGTKSTPSNTSSADSTSTPSHEEQLLNRIDTHFSEVHSRLSSVTSQLSELSSQLSVMDSRLSAVDIFVTMQRMNKTWKGLAPRLASLETTNQSSSLVTNAKPTENVVKSTQESLDLSSSSSGLGSTNIVHKMESFSDSSDSKNNNSTSMSFSFKNTNLSSDFSCTPQTQMDISEPSQSNIFLTSASNPQTTLNVNNLSKENISGMSFDMPTILNSSKVNTEKLGGASDTIPQPSKSEHSIQISHNDSNVRTTKSSTEDTCTLVLAKKPPVVAEELPVVAEKPPVVAEKPPVVAEKLPVVAEKPPVVAEELPVVAEESSVVAEESPVLAKDSESKNEENVSDTENEFEIIGKEELAELPVNVSNKNEQSFHLSQLSSDEIKNFKIYKDMTEYMEITLGKKKDSVYEFKFVAKPELDVGTTVETSSVSSLTKHDGSLLNASDSLEEEDSFSKYVSHLLTDDKKQSTPILKTQKGPKDVEGKNLQKI